MGGSRFRYVLLGGGNAAGYAALAFVQRGLAPGELCIIGEESVPPYERPTLSKAYLSPEDPVRLPNFHTCRGTAGELQTAEWYEKHGIQLLLGTEVTAARLKERQLVTRDGHTVQFEYLIIATGSRAVTLEELGVGGADASNIFYLRNVRDADALASALAEHKGGRVIVIGGGYIGVEVAGSLLANGMKVTMVFPDRYFLHRQLSAEISSFYERFLEAEGVAFIKGTHASAIEKDRSGKVAGVRLRDGRRIAADMVVVGVGARANSSLFVGQLEMVAGGIKTDEHLRSSHPAVFAVGDVAKFPLSLYSGDLRRIEHVDHARRSAVYVVSHLRDPANSGIYNYLPFSYSRLLTLQWVFFGEKVGDPLFFGSFDGPPYKFGAYWVRGGHVLGVFLEGSTEEEKAAAACVAWHQPSVVHLDLLSQEGLSFCLKFWRHHGGKTPYTNPLTGAAPAYAAAIVAAEPSSRETWAGVGQGPGEGEDSDSGGSGRGQTLRRVRTLPSSPLVLPFSGVPAPVLAAHGADQGSEAGSLAREATSPVYVCWSEWVQAAAGVGAAVVMASAAYMYHSRWRKKMT